MIPSGQKEWSLGDKRMIPSGHKEWSLGDTKNDPKGTKKMIPLHVVLFTCSNNQTEVTTIEMWHCPRMESRIPCETPFLKKRGTSKFWDALGLKKRRALGFDKIKAKAKGKDFFHMSKIKVKPFCACGADISLNFLLKPRVEVGCKTIF